MADDTIVTAMESGTITLVVIEGPAVHKPGMPSCPKQQAPIPKGSPQLMQSSSYLKAIGFAGAVFESFCNLGMLLWGGLI